MTTPTPTPTPTPALATRRHAVFHPLVVSALDRLTEDAVAVTFAVPDELRADYAYTAGQHLTLRTRLGPEEVRRNYSLCAPATGGHLRVAVKRLAGGAFSAFANDSLRAGDVVEVMTPTGRFTTPLDPGQAKGYAALVAGSGITPVLSLLATILEVEPLSTFTLVYGNRTTGSVMFLDELADLKDRYATRLSLVHVLSREAQEVELFAGRIDAAKVTRLLETLVPPASVDEWFLCGPFAMVEEARETLLAAGVDRARIHLELFHVEGEAPRETSLVGAAGPHAGSSQVDAGSSQVTVLLDGRASRFAMARSGGRILDAALTVRADAPYACKGGVCGTCRALVVSGEVTMERNYALERDELSAGFVLACQSRPVSDEVTLDFDR